MDEHERQNRYLHNIERLRGGALERMSWQQVYDCMDELTDGHRLIVHPSSNPDKFGRARKLANTDACASISDLKYPSPESCHTSGRCNRPYKPICYAGIGTELCLSEIEAIPNDIVGLLHFSPKTELLLLRLGALDLWRKSSGLCQMDGKLKAEIADIHKEPRNITAFLFDAFISDFFSRPASPSVHKVTSAFTEMILDQVPRLDGIMYDSVSHARGTCVAVRASSFDEKTQPANAQVIQVTTALGYGIYDFKELKRADNFLDDRIQWKATEEPKA